ncbi:MAG: chitobiase/beta-hexosaminidase C-terminal domain-containing protein [Acidobacteriaceae bacterium]|nr:chitobiase/beta-hexosaminidase C-terminal domain-containing protein [Acidobacteriaceae bacterium]MBV9779965.1 chitobiase/beta-hexosaminidase C-terminal domain-containing protein [Acidobacteriaceae bacterium]
MIAALGLQAQTASPYRTVMDTELGTYFTPPNNFPWTDYGAYMGAGPYTTVLAPDALKGHYGHFNHFSPWDESLGFPYLALRQYEAQEVAAGRPPIFVTATYKGKKRPVLFSIYLNLLKNRPRTAPAIWTYAVNVADDRFIKFWINRYVRPNVLAPMQKLKNVWVYLDGCQFSYGSYGVLDDNGEFVGGIPWDPPFPQNATDYLNSIAQFFKRVSELAPDIKINTDVGQMSDPTQFPNVYANVAGALLEDAIAWQKNPSQSNFNSFYKQVFPWFSWLGATGRVGILGANLPANWQTSQLLSAFVIYELVKGPNFFFGPRYLPAGPPQSIAIPPSDWEGWNAALGLPVSAMQQGPQQPGGLITSRLFWRQFTNGYVYLNWTSATQSVKLPSGKWVDAENNPLTTLQIPPSTGMLVRVAGHANVAQAPSISPRSAYTMSGPVTVTIANNTPNATVRYTTDGSAPNFKSPIYTGPFQLTSSAVVEARAFLYGDDPSGASIAPFNIVKATPTVQFTTSSDQGAAGGPASVTSYFPVLVLSAVPNETVTVTYMVVDPAGGTTAASKTFLPGEIYTQFPVSVSGAGTWQISIIAVTGATVGDTTVLQYSRS